MQKRETAPTLAVGQAMAVNEGHSAALWLTYRSFLLALLMAELLVLTPPFDTAIDLGGSRGGQILFQLQHGLRRGFITAVMAAVVFGWRALTDKLRQLEEEPGDGRTAFGWLMVHVVVIAPLVIGSAMKRPGRMSSMGGGAVWVLSWTTLGAAALISLGLAALPIRFWRSWVQRNRGELLSAAAVGVLAYLLGNWCKSLWGMLQQGTFAVVVTLLTLAGMTVQTDSAQCLIATPNFAVQIAPVCSGIEGIGLVAVFLTAYLWLYRTELRFPHALLLLPLGMLSIWFLNSFRIAALVVIGEWAPQAAARGFHSVVGWLFFNAVIWALVMACRHSRFFRLEMRALNDRAGTTTLSLEPEGR
jgi:exosortase E/protease (VPEID-CTERM system)